MFVLPIHGIQNYFRHKISSHFFHSLSGLRSKFNHIISQILFSNVIEDQLRLEIRKFIQIPPFFHLSRPAKFKSASLNHKFFWISSKWSKNMISLDLYFFVIKILRAIIMIMVAMAIINKCTHCIAFWLAWDLLWMVSNSKEIAFPLKIESSLQRASLGHADGWMRQPNRLMPFFLSQVQRSPSDLN